MHRSTLPVGWREVRALKHFELFERVERLELFAYSEAAACQAKVLRRDTEYRTFQ